MMKGGVNPRLDQLNLDFFLFFIFANAVPNDARYQEIEIRSQDTLICSEVTDSSTDKCTWCERSWNADRDSARIRNLRFVYRLIGFGFVIFSLLL